MFDTSPSFYALQAIGFATGAALCCMLGALQLRIDRVEKISSHYSGLWVICLAWNIGNFFQYALILAGQSPASKSVGVAAMLAWSAVTGGSPSILYAVQRSLHLPPALKRPVLLVSVIGSTAIVFLFGAAVLSERAPLPFSSVIGLSFASAVAHWAICGVLFLIHRRSTLVVPPPQHQRNWFKRIIFAGMLLLLAQTIAFFSGGEGGWLGVIARIFAEQWSIPFVVVMAAFLADSIYADVVLKRTLRLLGCVCISALFMRLVLPGDDGLSLVLATIFGSALLFGAPWLKRKVDGFVDKVLLKRPDYDAIAVQFAEEVSRAASKDDVMELVNATTRDALKHRAALDPALTMDIPLATYTPAPDSVSQLFMQGELAFVRTIGKEASRRIDVLANEIERREARVREERLRHGITEAQLVALRAQVNPHFLFNTLNSIAELISSAPQVAEAMTERLAEFFRYTLARSQQTLSTVREELEFTRHYLEIESIRFGERLTVQIDGDAGLADMKVPSLILQPLVENAVRHGIAPKLGGGTVWVSAQQEGHFIQLRVRDDGVGLQAENSIVSKGSGVGLRNVRERLRSLHGDKAVVTITSGLNGCGTSVTLLLPIDGN